MVSARVLEHRVADESQTSETTRVYANPDGSWTTEEASGPSSSSWSLNPCTGHRPSLWTRIPYRTRPRRTDLPRSAAHQGEPFRHRSAVGDDRLHLLDQASCDQPSRHRQTGVDRPENCPRGARQGSEDQV